MPSFWKSLNRHISVKNRPILMKFGTLQQLLNSMRVTWPNIEIYKIQDGGGRHLEKHFLAVTHQAIVRFQQNLVGGSGTACRQRPHGKNCTFFKIQDGGRPPFWKLLNHHILVKIIGFWWQLVYYTNHWTWWQKLNRLKFKMADGCHLRNRFFNIPQQSIVRFQHFFCNMKQNSMPKSRVT